MEDFNTPKTLQAFLQADNNSPPKRIASGALEDYQKYPQYSSQSSCPNCGYCPTCGRSNHYQPTTPYYQYWYSNSPYWSISSDTVAIT